MSASSPLPSTSPAQSVNSRRAIIPSTPGALAFLVHSQETVANKMPPEVDNKALARQRRRRTRYVNFECFLQLASLPSISSMFGTNGVATRSKARTLLGSRPQLVRAVTPPSHPIPCRLLTTSSQQGGRRHSQGRVPEEPKARQSRASRNHWQSRAG
jgi:hypothetical protein